VKDSHRVSTLSEAEAPGVAQKLGRPAVAEGHRVSTPLEAEAPGVT
jgi:hypothetical protein